MIRPRYTTEPSRDKELNFFYLLLFILTSSISTADVLNKLFGNVSMSSTFDALDQDTVCELLTSVFCLVTIGFKSGNSVII